ncbi:MAG: serine/threonine-protein kinase [Gemmataceae bacterium]
MSDPIRGLSVIGEVEKAVAEVIAEITDRLQAGQSVDVEAYVARYPEAEERIRRLVPALTVMESLKSTPSEGEAQDQGLTGTLGDFRIIREVGRGGMGVVYEADQISLGRRVALKVLPFAATADPRQLKRFHNEARAAASLEHPSVVPVYGVGCERGVHYYAMRFVDGRTLAQLIESLRSQEQPSPTTPYFPGEPAPPSETTALGNTTRPGPRDSAYFRRVAEWVAQAAEALEDAHQHGVIHRDVKPHNLMVDEQGKLWVTDFGLARLAADGGLTMSGDLLGTLRYMAPEQALARTGLVDHRADVYGLGATLYELLTLKPAVTGDDKKAVLYRIAFEEPAAPRKLNRGVPRDLETITLEARWRRCPLRHGGRAWRPTWRRTLECRLIRGGQAGADAAGACGRGTGRWCGRGRGAAGGGGTRSGGRLAASAAGRGWSREAEVALDEAARLHAQGRSDRGHEGIGQSPCSKAGC